MHHIIRLAGLASIFFSSCITVAHGDEKTRTYIYDGVGEAKKTSIVVDFVNKNAELRDKGDALVPSLSGITHDFDDCSDSRYYCLSGMLEIVVPKNMPIEEWEFHGLSCRSVAQAVANTYRINCQSHKYRGHPTYTYSLYHGIVSIESSPVAGDYRYELRGQDGLFSSENRPREVP